MAAAMTQETYRSLFPITQEWTYLQNASIGPLSKPVLEAIDGSLRSQSQYGTERYPDWLDTVESVRRSAAELLGAHTDEVSFVRNTAEGLSRIAFGLDWRSGDNIVTNSMEYPTNVLPWLALQAQGVETRIVPDRNGRLGVDDFREAVDDRTRLIAVSSVQFSNGYNIDLEALGQFCRENGILLSVDAIQHLGVLPLDVKKTPVDFVSAGAHKWLLSPCGTGVFYVRRELLDQLRVVEVGYAGMDDYSLHDDFLDYNLAWRSTAQRFEGGLANFSGLAGMGASIELFLEIGIDRIREHVLSLTELAVGRLRSLGYHIISPRDTDGEKSGIVSFYHSRYSSADIKQFLARHKISISVRVVRALPVLRISPHYYNTHDEIEHLVDVLRTMK